MGALLAPLAVAALFPVAPPGWHPDVAAAAAFARTRPGQVSFAVRVHGRHWGYHAAREVPAASLFKPLVLIADLRAHDRRHRRLLGPMIRRSDSDAASRLLEMDGAWRVRAVARRAGMHGFSVEQPWGNSPIRADDQARFFLRLPERLPRRARPYGLYLLRSIVRTQRWGVARAAPRGWRLYFKGGWGSGSGAVDSQSALLVHGRQRVALSILTTAQGSHVTGKRTLEGVARRLLRGLPGY